MEFSADGAGEWTSRRQRWYGARVSPGARLRFGALGAASALVPALLMWGFTVDDALIPIRYAHHLATGAGYRFDAGGPSTDGVTPLPWAFLLAPLSRGGDAIGALVAAKALGVAAWTAAGAALGLHLGPEVAPASGSSRRGLATAIVALLVMALAFPIGAWAASGMETGLATALATLAATRIARPTRAAFLAGLAASLRPEMVVWAVALSVLAAAAAVAPEARSSRLLARRVAGAGALAAGPFFACAVVRLAVFGRAAPLAVLAKPSDLEHGATYAAAAAVVLLLPLLALAPFALARGPARGRVIALAFLAHLVAVTVAGGDWMPYARLVVPVAPSLVIAVVATAPAARTWSVALRAAGALVLGAFLVVRAAPAGRSVHADRADLVARARPALAGAETVAALDIGWVGAATEARIVDLAGLTDPSIASLPGGHTSKRVDVSMLLDRGVDAVVVYSEPRVVEARITGSPLFVERFERGVELPVGARGAFYTVYRRRR